MIDLPQVGNTGILHLKSSFEAYSFQFPASYIWIRKGFEISFHKVELPTIPAVWKLRTALSIIDFLANGKIFLLKTQGRKSYIWMRLRTISLFQWYENVWMSYYSLNSFKVSKKFSVIYYDFREIKVQILDYGKDLDL